MRRAVWAIVALALLLGVPARADAQEYYNAYRTLFTATTLQINGIAATSTDGFTLANNTAATAGVPVQQSPRLRFRSNVWNTTAVAANNTDDWFIEPLLGSAAAPTSVLRFLNSANGGAATVPMTINKNGSLTAGAFLVTGTSYYNFLGRGYLQMPADGQLTLQNTGLTGGVEFNVSALPTAGTCGTSPAVTAGSTPLAGSIDVGTGTPASCVLIFGGTAFPSAPFCTANVVTSTAGNTRAIGTLSTTTQVTFTPASAFAASSVVAYTCISSK